ncbi:MAG: DUF2029 domain-containing protein [Phycisphaerae bacterium]|nr:DUF2029 domain-containing protein [Phycisphaerae bacterium]
MKQSCQNSESNSHPSWALPYETLVPADRSKRRLARGLRIAAYVLFLAAMIIPIVQLESTVLRNQRRARGYDTRLQENRLTEKDIRKGRPKATKGAVNRWRTAVHEFWDGKNIYLSSEQKTDQLAAATAAGKKADEVGKVALHPNMPFVVILLTPFLYLPMWAGGLVFTIVKVLVVLVALLAAVRVVDHRELRMPDWIVGLGIVWWLTGMTGDIQHANTNGFVLGAIVFHLWLYRRGKDLTAGVLLALAICIKMTPALFVLYWIYQRNWKLLRSCLGAGILFAVIIPAVLVGPSRYRELTTTWYQNLIKPGLVKGAWYPIHINQSIPGVVSRYLLGGQPGGDINWNPDDTSYENVKNHKWIAVASLDPQVVKRIIQGLQVCVVVLMGWAIGWRKLPRDDGRRGLHYAMVLAGILLLNQRSWGHHAAILLPGFLAVWYAVAFGNFTRRRRLVTLIMIILCGAISWLSTGELTVLYGKLAGMEKPQAKEFADYIVAYGTKFTVFLLLFITAAVLALGMKKSDPPYSSQRQKL